jgi:hypothetical protein
MKKLQREALKYYPLQSTEAIRYWMSWRVGMKAADIANQRMLENIVCPIVPISHLMDLWI